MYDGKTLVVILCMHRSGSSLTANVLHRLGMSLGPFDLLGCDENNRFGYFEPRPLYELDMELQEHALGFCDDVPQSPDVLRRFVENEGRWDPNVSIPDSLLERGKEFVGRLIESGPICGFKDPRIPLLWPYWSRVLSSFDGLRIVPLLLIRSPHEIAMSIFKRSSGELTYQNALDVTAVHFKRISGILEGWQGVHALVRFDSEMFSDDLCRAAQKCGLKWCETALREVYDAGSQHHAASVVTHPAQKLFEHIARLADGRNSKSNLRQVERDATQREEILRANLRRTTQRSESLRREAETLREQHEQFREERKQACREREQARQERMQLLQQLDRVRQRCEQAYGQREQIRQNCEKIIQQRDEARRQCEQARGQREQIRQNCEEIVQQRDEARRQCEQARGQREQIRQNCDKIVQQRDEAQRQCEQARQKIEALTRSQEQLQADFSHLRRSRLLKLRDRLLAALRRTPILRSWAFVATRNNVSLP